MTDPVDAAVVRSGLVSTTREMFASFKRTSMLPHLYEALDFSVSLFDDRQNLVADTPGLPEFVGSLSIAMRAIVERFDGGRALRPGDVLVANDPFVTGGHPPDAALIAPAFLDGQLIGYSGMRAHMGDLGAINHDPANATSIYDEGLILPLLRLVERGVTDEAILSVVAANSRLPRETVGNFRSAAATLARGATKLEAVVRRFGIQTYHDAIDQLLNAAEYQARQELVAIPDGVYHASERLELGEGAGTAELRCVIKIDGSDVHVDVTDSPAQQPCAMNVPLPQTIAACRLALKRLTTEDNVTANSGEYRMLTVTAPPGSIFNAQRPAATYMMATTASLLSEMVVTALTDAGSARAMAQSGGHTTGFMALVELGHDGRSERVDDVAPIGYGATPDRDGMDAALHFCLAGMEVASGEVLETRAPVIKRGSTLLADSGGAGRHRGGVGTCTTWEMIPASEMTIQAQKTLDIGGAGRDSGGAAGGRNDVRISGIDGERTLGLIGGITVAAGSVIDVFGAGGGGFGSPYDRDPAAVLDDVLDGLVSVGAARDLYGVVVDGDAVNAAQTSLLRGEQ